jgi:hypothetical protein
MTNENGATAIDALANKAPIHTVMALLNIGWPNDYSYRLYVGALLSDPSLVKEALDHGADPNESIRNSGPLTTAITRASQFSWKETKEEQKPALAVMELLLKAGARIDEGSPTNGGGDIVRVYAYNGNDENIQPILDLLVQYATPAARKNSLHWLKLGSVGPYPQRQANLEWLIKRLEQ